MFSSSTTPFTMPVTPASSSNGFGGSWGDGAWWIILFFIIIFGGWGNGYGNSGSGAYENYVLNSDFSTLSRQMDSGFTNTNGLITTSADQLQRQITSVANGISSLGYDQLNRMNGISTGISQATYDLSTQLNNIASTQQSCCCTTNNNMTTGFSDINYRLATDTCAINTNVTNAIRDVIDNDNANYRALNDRLTAMESSAKDEKIATLQSQLSDARLVANNEAQTVAINSAIAAAIQQLQPVAKPAFVVNPPYPYTSCSGCSCAG